MSRKIDVDEFLDKYKKLYEGNQEFLKKSKVPERTKGYLKCMEDTMYLLRRTGTEREKVSGMNRLETEIENHRLRAMVCENIGNTNEAKNERYLYECLSLLKNINDCGDCNVCASQKDCQYVPTIGQMVRYNCPFYKKEGERDDGLVSV